MKLALHGLKALLVAANVLNMSICVFILCTRLVQLVIYNFTRSIAN